MNDSTTGPPDPSDKPPSPGPPSPGPADGATIRIIPSAELFRGAREVLIQHGDEVYRLRLTRNGKLLLFK